MIRSCDDHGNQGIIDRERGPFAFASVVVKASSIELAANRDATQRHRHDALERRLVQLRCAMGEPEQAPVPAAQAPVEPPAAASSLAIKPEPAPAFPPETAAGAALSIGETHRKSSRWLAWALIPVVAVAGSLWWMAQGAPAHDPALPAVLAEAPAPAPVAPPAEALALADSEPVAVDASPDASDSVPQAAESATIAVALQSPAEILVAADNAEERALAILEEWRAAWSNRDTDAYLSHYSDSFVAANGQDRATWAETRRKNFGSRNSISVKTYDVHATRLDDRRIQLVFLQDYESGGYREKAQPKVFLLIQEGQDWRIAGEWQGKLTVPASGTS